MGILSDFHQRVLGSFKQHEQESFDEPDTNNLIALGVLLWIIADADNKFLSQESEKIKEILQEHSNVPPERLPVVIQSIEQAAKDRIDMYSFIQDVSKDIERSQRISIVENLFRVACVDQDLDNEELEMIRKISGLLRLDHSEFIDAKVKIKKEFSMDTSGL